MKPDTSKSLCSAGTLHVKQTKVNENHMREFTEKIKSQANTLGEHTNRFKNLYWGYDNE